MGLRAQVEIYHDNFNYFWMSVVANHDDGPQEVAFA